MTTYLQSLTQAMTELAAHPRSVFLGQSVLAGGTAMTQTFAGVPRDRLIEFPVAEETQMGTATGLALGGDLPVCVFPRINFMLLAISQIVLHLDALPLFSEFRPKVIIRTAICSPTPLDPGVQHLDPTYDDPKWVKQVGPVFKDVSYLEPDGYIEALKAMLRTVYVYEIQHVSEVLPAYREALARPLSTILVERAELYDQE